MGGTDASLEQNADHQRNRAQLMTRNNALAETINGLYKTEVIKHRGPWRTVEQVEFATAEWVDWFNHRRLYEYCGDIPPAELEAAYYRETQPHHPVGSSETK
jgi:putative transposase